MTSPAPGGLPGSPADRTVFPALDTLRAVASFAVVATHAAYWAGDYAAAGWGTALSRLDVGVAVFFVLSGFLLSRPWFVRHAQGQPMPGAGRYLWKRLLRIAPVYLVTVVAAYLLLPANDDATVGDWIASLLMLDLYVDDRLPAGLTQMWSLGTEVAFYVLLPLLMWLTLSRRRDRAAGRSRLTVVLIVMTAVTVVWLLDLSVRWDGGGTMIRLWLPSYLTWFGAGLLLAACSVPGRPSNRVTRTVSLMGTAPGACWTAALALLAVAATPLAGPADLAPATLGAALTKNLLYAAIAALVVLPGIFAPAGSTYVRSLSHPVLRHLGHLSYGVFCIHLIVMELVADWRGIELFRGRGLELFVLTLVISLVVAEILYRSVERPVMRWKDLGRHRSGSSAATAETVTSASS